MDEEILYADFHFGYAMDNFVNKRMKKLEHITLMEIINDSIYRRLFVKFMEKLHLHECESMILLKRFILCQKFILNHDLFEDREYYGKLIELSPTYLWEQKIQKLKIGNKEDLNFVHVMETLKWETIIDLICHSDYKYFLSAIKRKSNRIKKLLGEIYKNYYF